MYLGDGVFLLCVVLQITCCSISLAIPWKKVTTTFDGMCGGRGKCHPTIMTTSVAPITTTIKVSQLGFPGQVLARRATLSREHAEYGRMVSIVGLQFVSVLFLFVSISTLQVEISNRSQFAMLVFSTILSLGSNMLCAFYNMRISVEHHLNTSRKIATYYNKAGHKNTVSYDWGFWVSLAGTSVATLYTMFITLYKR